METYRRVTVGVISLDEILKYVLLYVVASFFMYERMTGNATGCGFDSELLALVTMQSAALGSGTHHAMPPELGGKYRTCVLKFDFERSLLTLGSQVPSA